MSLEIYTIALTKWVTVLFWVTFTWRFFTACTIYVTYSEINKQLNINKKYEEQLLKDYYTETERRSNIFKNFLFNINKVRKFDKKIEEIYNILDPIIDSYCGQFIENCKLDKETYNKIFDTLKQIRNDQQAFDILKTIIFIEE